MYFKPVEYENAPDNIKAIYDEILIEMQIEKLPNWVIYLGSNELILKGNWEKFRTTILNGQLPMLLKQIVLYVISTHCGSKYCIAAHAHAVLELDTSLSYHDLEQFASNRDLNIFPEKYRDAIEFGIKCGLTPRQVSKREFEHLSQSGYTDEELLELVAQADVGVMFNFVTALSGAPIDNELKKHLPDTFLNSA